MGKDKAKPTPPSASAATPAPALAPGTRPPKGHKQRGAGTVIVAKPAVVTGDGIVLKAHERLPCQLLQEYCQKEKRPNAKFIHASPGPKFRVVLPDSKNSKNDLTFCPTQTFPSDSVARDFAALLALFHLQRQFPLERRMPEPYASSWLSMIAAEKEQTKQTGADSKNTKTTPMSSSTVASTSAQSTPSAATAAGPGVALAGSKADKAEADQGASKNSSKGSNSNLAAIAASLNRDTSDWLCDNCSNQNFALLASGQPRVKCFRCGTPKSATCQLVASSTTAIPTTAASTTASSTSSAPAKPAIAAVNLLVGKNANYVSKAEEERAVQEKRALQKRKQYYFDALRRANRPHIVHIPTALRVKLERLLGMTTSGCNSSYGEEGGEELSLEEVLQTYQESGLFPPDLCNMTTDQQMSILQRVSKHLLGQGFSVQYVASSLREVLLQSANDLLDDAIDTAEGSADSSAGLDSRKVSATFEKLLSEACLKNLCMTVEESALPDAYNPKFFENSKKLSVVSAPVALGAPPSTASPALSVQKAGSVSSGSASASASAVNDGPAVDLLATVDPELRPVLLQLCVYCNCFLASSLSVTTATATTAITQEDCKTAMLTAVSLLPSFPTATSNGYGGPHDRKIQFLALLILQEASLFTPASAQQLLSPALQRLRSCCTAESDASTADFSEVADEIESLQAIFEDNVRSTLTSDGHLAHYYVTLKITLEHLQRARQSKHVLKSLGSLDLMIIVHQLAPYPTQVPLIYLHSSCSSGAVGKMTAGAAAAVCALQTQLRQKAAEFAGELMIFQLYSYLQECIDNIATASAMGGASAVSATSTSVSAEEGEGAESGVSARLPVVSNRLAAISAYLTGNDALYDTLIQASQVPSSNAAASTATDTGAKKGDTEADRAADIDASDSYTVTTAATETTSTFTSNSNSSSVAPNKYNQGTRKGPNVHSFWSPIPSNDATNNASSSATQSKAMLESRRKLPSWNKREEVINLVQSNRAIVVTGETGCGKTTQVPQFLYETNPQQKIVICQPRRLAAVGVATRVAEEVGCAVGQEVSL